MRKLILINLFIFWVGQIMAQQANLDRAEKALADGYFERALNLSRAATEHEKTKKNPLGYYLYAMSLFELTKDEYFAKKNPDAFKDACKLILKAKMKDKENKFEGRFDDKIAEMVEVNNQLGYSEYQVNRFPKAIKYYTLSCNMNEDITAYYMIGKCYQLSTDTAQAKSYYKALINRYDEAHKKGESADKFSIDPFIFLADVYTLKKAYDSANFYLEWGRIFFGNSNARLNYTQYLIAKEQILKQQPSSLMLEVVRKALVYSPTDTFLVKKENAISLYLIRNMIGGASTIELDSMVFRFAKSKTVKAANPEYEVLRPVDIFLQVYPEDVLWKMSDYYYTNTHDAAAAYLAKLYIGITSAATAGVAPTEKELIGRWIKIIQFCKENEAPGFTALLLNQAVTDFPKSKEIEELKKKLSSK